MAGGKNWHFKLTESKKKKKKEEVGCTITQILQLHVDQLLSPLLGMCVIWLPKSVTNITWAGALHVLACIQDIILHSNDQSV